MESVNNNKSHYNYFPFVDTMTNFNIFSIENTINICLYFMNSNN